MSDNMYSQLKTGRILQLYTKLVNGESICKADEADFFGVSTKSIQRDIDDLRAFFQNQVAEGLSDKQLVYDKTINSYYLQAQNEMSLSNSEILAVCKILLESRAFCKSEMEPIMKKLLNCCVPKNKQSVVKALIANEQFHYVEPHHGKQFVESLWDIGAAVHRHNYMEITYEKQDGTVVERTLKPAAILFSEYYFYLAAFIEGIDKQAEFRNPDDAFPTIYRVDRIRSFTVSDKHFDVPYRDRFEEGEFRKRIQFMYGGKLRKIQFLYKGACVEAVLDRLPTAKIIEERPDGFVIAAEVFGDGVDMWLRSQGDNIIYKLER